MKRSFFLTVLLLFVLLSGCVYSPAATQNVPVTGWDSSLYGTSISSPNLQDYAQLVRAVTTWGMNPQDVGTVRQPYFNTDARVFQVKGEQIQVFSFNSVDEQKKAAAQVTNQGQKINGTPVTWTSDPHFWANGTMIVLYVGKDPDIIRMLTSLLGQPINS